jgi:hypothetical protein
MGGKVSVAIGFVPIFRDLFTPAKGELFLHPLVDILLTNL